MIDFKRGELFKLSKTKPEEAKIVFPLLVQGEEVIGVYKAVRDVVVFTTKRVIAANVQGVTGAKKDFTSIPYSKVQAFSVETAGTFDRDSELEMWISGLGSVKFDFAKDCDIVAIGKHISNAIL